MALVLKFFVIEAYQIPTGSMQPTVMGDAEAGIQDRVLADKLGTLLRDPRRWEVMIFRLPYDERQLYVKRIIGLPGETLEVAGGDIWIDDRIARKPDHVNESVLKAVFPVKDGGIEVGRWFRSSQPGSIEMAGTRAVFPPGSQAELRLAGDVLDDYLHGYDPEWHLRTAVRAEHAVSDLDVALDVTLGSGASALELRLLSDEGELFFSLPREGSGGRARVAFRPEAGGPERVLLDDPARSLPVGRAVRVLARDVDRRTILRVDGEEWVRAEDDASGRRTDRPSRAMVSLGIPGGGTIDNLVLRRDIFYTRPNGTARWEIPGDSYFALGDNTQASLDGRKWALKTYTLKDGRSITGFWFPERYPGSGPTDANPRLLGNGRLSFADTHGDVFEFAESDVVSQDLQPSPFIPARNLLGKAIAVFWPVYHPFRWKLIR